jgi:hypothetical protein
LRRKATAAFSGTLKFPRITANLRAGYHWSAFYRTKEFGLFQFFVNGGHQFADLDSLRAFLFALAALYAGACPFSFLEKSSVLKTRGGHVVIYNAVVVEFNYSGNVHALGTG